MSQSTHAMTSSRIGEPLAPAVHLTPSNLLPPRFEKLRHSSSCSALRTLAQNLPASRINGQLVELFAGMKATSGGSSETEVNVPTTIPTGPSALIAVTTEIPVG